MVDYCNNRSTSSTLASVPPGLPNFRTATKGRNHREKSTHHHHHHKSLGDGGDASQQARVRTVRLVRPQSHGHRNPPSGANFGFSIRGGLEYGTGFFISAIERESEADRQGLKVGDQIIRVNGYQVEDAVHRELAQFIANQERLIMKVRGLGIVPIKERTADPLTWHVVSFGATRDKKDSLLLDDGGACCGRDLKVILSVAPRTKLGCGICKGPDWKPGIFVQFTKEGGVAREAGLRPGDQILSCNGHSFAEVSFGEAVGIMKSSHVLELVVRPNAGLDLFPGESSGYNSSASSVNGDQSPCWGDQTSKRLSIVREESISHERRRTAAASAGESNRASCEKPSTAPPPPPPQPQQHQQQQKLQQVPQQQQPSAGGSATLGQHRKKNTTIIEFSERGTIVNPEAKQSETKTIIVEVHRSASTGSIGGLATGAPVAAAGLNASIIPPPPPLFADSFPPGSPAPSTGQPEIHNCQKTASPQSSSLEGPAELSDPSGNSLSSAISDELRRRAQKKNSPPGADGLASVATGPAAALTELENRLKEKGARLRPVTMAISDERHTALMDEFRAVHKRMFKNGFDNAELKKQPSKISNVEPNGSQPCDGSTRKSPKGTMGRVAASEMAKASGDSAELESIESFKLTNPQPPPARPPSYYFCPQATGPPTMKKSQKPIAVTISEYAHSASHPDEPKKSTRLEFGKLRSVTEGLVGGGASGPARDGTSERPTCP
uniref:PDZ domain-containing protein n=1 Tax=Anopheles atroparvus TaxID=41427 RepID=A0AAG5CU65_ANOAO